MEGYKDQAPKIAQHQIPEIHLYQVTKEEINKLSGEGSNADIYLNAAISCFSIVVSLVISVLTCSPSEVLKVAFLAVAFILFLAAIVLFFLFRRGYKDRKKVKDEIFNR